MFPASALECLTPALLQVGLDCAGKTTTLYKLHLGEAVKTQPTVGSNVEQITYKNLQFEVRRGRALGCAAVLCLHGRACRAGRCAQVWDLGGQANLRPSWAAYYKATDAVIVVIDSTDRARVTIAKARPLVPCPQQDNRAAAAKALQRASTVSPVAKLPRNRR